MYLGITTTSMQIIPAMKKGSDNSGIRCLGQKLDGAFDGIVQKPDNFTCEETCAEKSVSKGLSEKSNEVNGMLGSLQGQPPPWNSYPNCIMYGS